MKEQVNLGVVVSGLEDYINQVGSGSIIKALAGSAPSVQYFAQQAGVNQPTDIHLMTVDGSFGNGKSCDVNDNASFTFTDRQLDPAIVKMEAILCKEELRGKWLAYQDKISASTADAIPFEEAMLEAFKDKVAENLEDWLWNGGTIGAKSYKGFADIIEEAGLNTSVGSTKGVWDMCVAVVKKANAKSRKATELFISEDMMLALKEELLKNDFRLFDLAFSNGTIVDENAIKLPVFGNIVHAVSALNGNEKVYGLVPAHAIYGYSVNGDSTDIAAIYNPYTEKTVIRARLAIATLVAYPSETIVCVKNS